MKRAYVIMVVLVTFLLFYAKPINAQNQDDIIINANGNVTSTTSALQQTNNTYTLTTDTFGITVLNASNIVLDGAGHKVSGLSLQGTTNVTIKNFIVTYSLDYSIYGVVGISLVDASNSLVRDNTVTGFATIYAMNGVTHAGILIIGGSANTITQNKLAANLDGLLLVNTYANLITENTITSTTTEHVLSAGIDIVGGLSNNIYHNNFIDCNYLVQIINDSPNVWDDGSSGNYWSDYRTKYPDAHEIDNTGIGNKQYIIDANNTDNYPLMQRYNTFLAAHPTPTPTPKPTTTPTNTPTKTTKPPTDTTPLTILTLTLISIIITLIAIYTKKQPR